MGKRFKFRISKVIPPFKSCRSKDPSALPSNPVPSFLRSSPLDPPQPVAPHRPSSSIKRHVSSAFTSIAACGCRSRSSTECLSDTNHSESPPTPEFQWEKEERYHVVAKIFEKSPRQKIYNSSASGDTSSDDRDVFLPPPPPPSQSSEKKKRRARRKKRTPPPKTRISTSSGLDSELFSDDENYWNDDEETETLVTSSRSLSTDSSTEFNPQLETIRETPFKRALAKRKKKLKKAKKCVSKASKVIMENNGGGLSSPEIDTPARLSLFLKRLMPCTVEGKVRDSFAVVKKSDDPYEDFKGSMIEMILEKQIFEEEDLKQLLQCFLSLNSRQHHRAIFKAFSEISGALFNRRSTSFRLSTCQ